MQITSSGFSYEETIPRKHSCDGEGISPALQFFNVPEAALSLVLICEDPDVPEHIKANGIFDHWLVWDIPATTREVPEDHNPDGITGKNSAGGTGYTGMCPPDGLHRYFFRLYALDTTLELNPKEADKDILLLSMEGHVLDSAELMGTYER